MVLISALLVLVFVASIATGYTVSRPVNDNGGAVLAKGNTVAYVNGESGRVEAEARALVSGKATLEPVTLADGRVAVVDNESKRVWLIDPATMTPEQVPVGPGKGGIDGLAVAAGPQHSYLINPGTGTVQEIDAQGTPPAPVQVPGGVTGIAVPDGTDGVWVLTEDGLVVQIRGGQMERRVDSGGRVQHLTLADGRPIAITDSGRLLALSAAGPVPIPGEPVPHGPNVLVGSPKGAGHWILIVNRQAGELIVVDPDTGARRTFPGLPGPTHLLGAPVVVGDLVYLPDHTTHTLYVRNARTGEAKDDIRVPGKPSAPFALEVHGEKVWANDQQDQRAVVIGPEGTAKTVDKGPGGGLSDTTTGSDGGTGPAAAPNPSNPKPTRTTPTPARTPPPTPAVPRLPIGPDPELDPGHAPPTSGQVQVPDIRPGTDKDEACRRIRDAGLLCDEMIADSDGPANEVISTDPQGGTKVPRGYRVTVRYHGPGSPGTVPDVVGRFSADACREIKAARLNCDSAPNPEVAEAPEQLDLVSAQDPAGGSPGSAGSSVTVRYWDRAVLGDYTNRPGTQACADLQKTYRRVECTVTEGQSEAQAGGRAAGTGYAQSPAPGTAIRMGETVTITVVKGSAHVPDVRGMKQDQACQRLAAAGYGCTASPDAIARHNVVTTQDTAPGTPLDAGGTVVIHYAPYEPVPLQLYQSDTGEPVFIIRRAGDPYPRYQKAYGGILGYGYQHDWAQPGTVMIWDHYCTSDKETCLGWSTNHYQSRDNKPFHDNWASPNEMVRFIHESGPNSCAGGQVPMYRFANFKGRDRDYFVAGSPPPQYTDYQEFLGCLWSP